jgi:hypothetical protein
MTKLVKCRNRIDANAMSKETNKNSGCEHGCHGNQGMFDTTLYYEVLTMNMEWQEEGSKYNSRRGNGC